MNAFAGSLSAFLAYAVEAGYIPANPMHGVAYPSPKPKPHRYLTRDQLGAVYQAAHDDADRLIVILLCTGLRAAELLSLRVEDVQDGLMLIKGKGAKYRFVPLPESAVALLPAAGPLVPLSYAALHYRVRAMGERAKIPRVHPHLFRHSWASAAVEELGVADVQAVGGWAKPALVEHYARSVYQRSAAKRAGRLRLL